LTASDAGREKLAAQDLTRGPPDPDVTVASGEAGALKPQADWSPGRLPL